MLRLVSEVADMEIRLGPAGRHVDSDFQHSRRHHVDFTRDTAKAGSVGFVEDAVEHVGLFFLGKKAGVQRFIVDARASNPHFLRPPAGTVAHRRGTFAMSNCKERLKTLRKSWFVGWADIKNAFHQMRIPGWLQGHFALPAVLASEVGLTGKVIDKERLVPDSVFTKIPKYVSNTFLFLKILPLERQNASSIGLMWGFQGRRCTQVVFYPR